MAVADKKSETLHNGKSAHPPEPTILVVDDEPLVLNLLEVYLRSQGFRVIPASGGREAIELYRENSATIDVVLLDVQMPYLSGPEVLSVLKTISPTVKSCFMSGHTGKYSSAQLTEMGAHKLFLKPMVLSELSGTLLQMVRKS